MYYSETILKAYDEVNNGGLDVVEFSGSDVVMINKELYHILASKVCKKLLDPDTEVIDLERDMQNPSQRTTKPIPPSNVIIKEYDIPTPPPSRTIIEGVSVGTGPSFTDYTDRLGGQLYGKTP